MSAITDADDASSALIAQLLAQDDQQLAGVWGLAYDDVCDDFDDSSERRKKRKSSTKLAKKRKAASKKTKSTKPPRVDPNDPRRKFGKWDEEEEKLFLEALELYGREWHKCVKHMNYSRNVGGFTSHAQKYFIKLY